MRVLQIHHDNHLIQLDLSPWNRTEKLLVDNQLVSEKHNSGMHGVHEVAIPNWGLLRLLFQLRPADKQIEYQVWLDDALIAQGLDNLQLHQDTSSQSTDARFRFPIKNPDSGGLYWRLVSS